MIQAMGIVSSLPFTSGIALQYVFKTKKNTFIIWTGCCLLLLCGCGGGILLLSWID